jgi:hypothetical protein
VPNGARFYFLHAFRYCPLREISHEVTEEKLLKNEGVPAVARYDKSRNMFLKAKLYTICADQ